ncbi:MAG: hypothetical protein ACLRMZ_23685 [Blautia marasmi]
MSEFNAVSGPEQHNTQGCGHTATRTASVEFLGFLNRKFTTKRVPTTNSARCRHMTNTKSDTKNWIINTKGSTTAIEVMGRPL